MFGFFVHPAWPYLVRGQDGIVSSLAWFEFEQAGQGFRSF